jgi:hypothetical protein
MASGVVPVQSNASIGNVHAFAAIDQSNDPHRTPLSYAH